MDPEILKRGNGAEAMEMETACECGGGGNAGSLWYWGHGGLRSHKKIFEI